MKFNSSKNRNRKPIPLFLAILGTALIISFLIFNHNQRQKKKAEVVYAETKKALELLADNLDKGLEKITHLNQFERTLQKIYNH